MTRIFIYLLFFGVFLWAEKTQEISISPKEGDNFVSSSFRLWIPDNLDQPKALLILLPGFNGNGLNLVEKSIWRELAIEKQIALIGCSFQCENGLVNYDEAQEGSGRVLEEAIFSMGQKIGLNLSLCKLMFFGHSAGGQFGFHFACWKPERTIAFVSSKGGNYNDTLVSNKTREIPAIWIMGERDETWRKEAIQKIVTKNKKEGAQWKFITDRKTGHEIGNSESIAVYFFKTIAIE